MILLSDGKRTEGSDPLAAAQRAKRLGIPVSTVALGTADGTVAGPIGEPIPVPPDPATLQEVSRITGGTFTEAADAGSLDKVYKELGSKVGTQARQARGQLELRGRRPAPAARRAGHRPAVARTAAMSSYTETLTGNVATQIRAARNSV